MKTGQKDNARTNFFYTAVLRAADRVYSLTFIPLHLVDDKHNDAIRGKLGTTDSTRAEKSRNELWGKLRAGAFSVVSLLFLMKFNKKKSLAWRGFKSEIIELH
jgi:hypothetical protein